MKVSLRYSGPWTITKVTSPISFNIEMDGFYPKRASILQIREWHTVREDDRVQLTPEVVPAEQSAEKVHTDDEKREDAGGDDIAVAVSSPPASSRFSSAEC